MNIESYIHVARSQVGDERSSELKKEQAATDFEELFAKHLVKEMTKGSFEMTDGVSGMGGNSLYREFITDALSSELAAQRKLGMADLVMEYWGQTTEEVINQKSTEKNDSTT